MMFSLYFGRHGCCDCCSCSWFWSRGHAYNLRMPKIRQRERQQLSPAFTGRLLKCLTADGNGMQQLYIVYFLFHFLSLVRVTSSVGLHSLIYTIYTNNNISVTPACGHLADAQSPSLGHVFGGQAEAALPIWYIGWLM